MPGLDVLSGTFIFIVYKFGVVLQELEQIPLFMSKPLEEVDPNENPAAAAFQQIKFEEETPEGTVYVHVIISHQRSA